jgi:hypothetical protein
MASFDVLARLDRRILYILMALAIVVPFLLEVAPAVEPSETSRALYDAVERLPPGAVVLLSCDYDPGSEAELYPMNVALLDHLARKDVRVVITQLWPQANPLVERALDEAYYPRGKEYGKDVVNLGYKAGGLIVISKMLRSIPEAFPEDVKKTPVSQIPAMRGVLKASDIDLFLILSAGTPGTTEWVIQCQARTDKPMGTGCTAVSSPEFFPYLLSKQLIGLLGGLRGAADYETLVGRKGRGVQGMGPQTFGHLLIVLLIVAGNVGHVLSGRGRRARP